MPNGVLCSERLSSIYRPRLRNNNFEIYFGLSTIAHGIFPQASRSFNHSCRPNALPIYVFVPDGLRQNIIAIEDIQSDEEVYTPYFG